MGKKEKAKTDKKKSIALWLDHVHAHFIELKKEKVIIQSVQSELESHVRFAGESKNAGKGASANEYHKQKRQQKQLHDYYKVLAKGLEKYQLIYLFGPTTAKQELLNWIRQTQHVADKTFIVDSAPEMTISQMVAKVRKVLG